jgi:hypothetical protein
MTPVTEGGDARTWTTRVLVAVLLGVSGCGGEVDCGEFTFDSQAWRDSSDDLDVEPGGERHDAAVALVTCQTLIGKPRSEVRSLLGRPEDGDRESELHYVAPDPLRLDDEILVVTFGRDGRVVDAELVTG